MKAAITLLLLAAGICFASARLRVRDPAENLDDNEILEQFLREHGINMRITTERPGTDDSRPSAVTPDPFEVEFLRPTRPPRRNPFHNHNHHSHGGPMFRHHHTTTTEAPEDEIEVEEEPQVDAGSMLTTKFMEHHEKWVESCMKDGPLAGSCKVCLDHGDHEQCHRVTILPDGRMRSRSRGSDLLPAKSKVTMKKHGLFEFRVIYETIGEPSTMFKVTIMEILEMIKKIMVAKEKMVECAPKLVNFEVEYNNTDFIFPSKYLMETFSSEDFASHMADLLMKMLEEGGNFCLGHGSSERYPANCMTIDWDPVCNNVSEGKPTLTLHRFADDAVINVRYMNETAFVDKSFRIQKQELTEAKEAIDSLSVLLGGARDSSLDASNLEQLMELAKSAIDFLINNLFRG